MRDAIEVYERIDSVFDEWEALADRLDSSPFQRPGWMAIWERHFSTAPVGVICVRREGRVVALLPFVRERGTLRSPTNFHSPEFAALAEDSEATAALFSALLAEPHRHISLGLLADGGRDAAECLAAAGARGERTLVRVQQESPYVEVGDATWATYERTIAAKLRSDLRRRARKLEELGRVTFEIADGRDRLEQLVAEGFDVEPSGWKAERGTAINSRADTMGFYAEVAAWAAGRGSLRLAFLRLDGRALAFQFGIEEGGVYYFLKGGFDPSFRQYAPGKLLARHLLVRAFEQRLRRFEFLGAAESWKFEWTATCRRRVAVSVFGTGLLGSAEWLAHRYGRPVAKRLLAYGRGWRPRARAANAAAPGEEPGADQLVHASR